MAASRSKPPARTQAATAFTPAVALVALAAVAGHLRSLGAPFFADDWLFLDQVRMRSWSQVLTSPDPIGNYFRPLGRQLWFSVWGALSGESAFVFHAANLACLVLALVMLARLGRRVAGPAAGVIAAAFLALHYATDVPVLWASGAQELLSLALVLVALDLHVRGARLAGALVFLCALLAKETVVLAPLVAVALDTEGGSWRVRARRAWGWAAAVGLWLLLVTLIAASRGTAGAGFHLTASGPFAVPVLLLRVVLGLEWVRGAWPWTSGNDPGAGGWLALLGVVAAVLWSAPRTPRNDAGRKAATPPARVPAHALRAGLVWAIAGAIPVAAVAPLWSAYYFLFALAGVGLGLGAWLAPRPPAVAIVVLLFVAATSNSARGLQEFATAASPWSAQSHVNRFYLERGMSVISRGIADLRSQMPAPEPRTTVFLAGLPSFAAFQVADGPLVRGVYRDTTLRSFFLSQMTLDRLDRGPWRVFFYRPETGRLVEETKTPGVLLSSALGMMLNGQPEVAEAALTAAARLGDDDPARTYVSAWIAFERGDPVLAQQRLVASGHRPSIGGEGVIRDVEARLARGDTLGAILAVRSGLAGFALEPSLHALAADVMLLRPATRTEGQVEAYAARLLAPGEPSNWRRWAFVLGQENRVGPALEAFERYQDLAPAAWAADPESQRLRSMLERMQPGGELAQRALKREWKP